MSNLLKIKDKTKEQLAQELIELQKRVSELETMVIKQKEIEKALSESETRLHDFFDNCNDLIQIVDPNCRFLYVNRKWQQVLGYSDEDVKQLTLWEIIRQDQHQHCQEQFKKICQGEVLNGVETVFVAKNGKEILVEGNVSARFEDGKFVSTRGIFRDITKRKQAEEALAKSNAELTKLNESKNQFLGMAAHDLRNPLTVVLTCSDFLLDQTSENLPVALKQDLLQRIKASAQFMLNLIDDLLDIAKIESGKLELRPNLIDLVTLVKSNVELNSMFASSKKIKIAFAQEKLISRVWADSARIEQVLNNLLGNAIKFSPPESTILVRVTQDSNWVTVAIQDQGPGIPPEELSGLFNPFHRTSVKATGGEKSTGLGLAIARKIVESHQGRIWVKSKVGKGSTFCFALPLARKPESVRTQRTMEPV